MKVHDTCSFFAFFLALIISSQKGLKNSGLNGDSSTDLFQLAVVIHEIHV